MDGSGCSEMELPGFRFHPTEEELLDFYLTRVVQGKKLHLEIITTINLYRYDPWELPGLAKIGEREWYFYVPRDRRQAGGGRPSRTTERGFWKATGCDRPVRSAADPKRLIGLKKTLVYYQGRAPRGSKTEWVMNEYRLPDPPPATASSSTSPPRDIVICKVYRKATSMKQLEQRAAAVEEEETTTSTAESRLSWCQESLIHLQRSTDLVVDDVILVEDDEEVEFEGKQDQADVSALSSSSVRRPSSLPELELEVPKKDELEWLQEPFWTQLRSPWMDPSSPCFASLLNC